MRIDSHQHFWRFDPARDVWITTDMSALLRDFLPEDLAPLLTKHSFDGCIAVEASQSLDQTHFLLALAHAHDFIRGVVGWVDLVSPELPLVLDSLAADRRLVGVRHEAQGEADNYLKRGDVVRGIAQLARHDLTYDILIYERQLPAAISLVTRLPEQRFVLDHLAKPRIRDRILEPWATHLREIARRPNVWCKLSGLVTEAEWQRWTPADLAPYLDIAYEAFGPDRMLFGSDWPVCLLAGDYGRVLDVVEDFAASLSDHERQALFGGTAARVYRLPALAVPARD